MTLNSSRRNRHALAALVLASATASALGAEPRVLRSTFDPIDAGPEGILRSWDVVNVGDGNWTVGGNWLPAGAPQPTDDIRLFQGDATNRTVTYDQPSISLNSLRIDATGNGQMTLAQGQGSLTTNELVVGIFGKGQYNLSAGSLQTGQAYVGAINEGVFNQTGGRHVNQVFLSMGNNAGAHGTYNMSGGTLTTSELDVGYFGTGSFNQSGSANVVATALYGIGFTDTGVGRYVMNGGSLLAPEGYVGLFGTGSFTQTGGTHTVLNNLSVGEVDTGKGTYTMIGGTLTANEFNIGYEGEGTLDLRGGTVNVGTFFSAAIDNSRGHGILAGGVLNVANEATIGVGTNSVATFIQNLGTLSVGGDLSLGYEPGSFGSYTQFVGHVQSNKLKVGYIGNGSFVQFNGTHVVNTYLSIADQAASVSTYQMRGGNLDVGELEVGYRGRGNMYHDGGTIDVGSFTAVGFVTSGRGLYQLLPGGTLNSPSTYVGLYGIGTFAQSGGVHNVPDVLSVGENVGAVGTYTLGGTGVINAGEVDVGFQGVGVFTQNGGEMTATELNVGASLTGVGTYNMTAGTLNVGEETVGFTTTSVGHFSQSGGTHAVTNGIHLAVQAGTDATFIFDGGSLSAAEITVGGGSLTAGGVARYTQGGGVLDVAGRVRVYGGSTLSLNNGSFSVGTIALNGGGQMRVGPGADLAPRTRGMSAVSGTLDLTDNALIVDYTGASPIGLPLGPFGSIANLIANGWNNGGWDGNGITTDMGNTDIFGIGYAEASETFGISGVGTATFRGQTVDATSVLVLYTFYGDATLDRQVNINDFALLAANFNQTGTNWRRGDFNYDEITNIADFALMARNFNLLFPSPLARPGAVPEPASLGLLAVAGAALARRRRA